MRRILTTFFAVFFLLESLPLNRTIVAAQSGRLSELEPDSGSVVCPPGVYEAAPDGCLPLGPSEYLTQIAATGIPYPILPLPAYTPPAALNDIPYRYFKVTDEGAPLFASLEDASSNQPSGQLAPGFLYVSYVGIEIDQNGNSYYRLRSDALIGVDGAKAGVPTFQGLLFSSQPQRAFGWVMGETNPRTAPGLNNPETGHTLYRYNIVQIYDTQEASNLTWNLVGPNEWVDSRQVARVDPHTAAPKGVTDHRWIEVDLFEQTISVYDNNQLVFATLVSTGVDPFWTRPGIFQIYEKKHPETMSGSTAADRSDYYYLEDVPWTMYFDEKRALHGAYWHNGFGYARSHGCVNLSVGDSHWLFDWANVGDTVYVYDPSGQTPVDSSVYGAGAP
ncbi:MAG: L,D-transpeptidase [Anaerolineales bacterium]|nr:L,D-transpeptidase [Anaerolineales bacterium]